MTGPRPRRPGSRPAPRRRPAAAIALGCGLGAILVVVVLVATRNGGGSTDEPSARSTTTVAATVPADFARSIKVPAKLPPGDYAPLCAELARQTDNADLSPGGTGTSAFIAIYRTLDFAPVIAAAPPGVKQAFEDLRDVRSEVIDTLGQISDLSNLDPADFPQKFLDSFGIGLKVGTEACAAPAGATTTTTPAPTSAAPTGG